MLKPGVKICRVYICCQRVDLRRGIDGLVSVVRLNYGLDPLEKGTMFLFCGRKRDRIKALIYEGDGFTLAYKRLSSGHYCWPKNAREAKCLTQEEYERLMNGFEIKSSIHST